VKGITVSKQIYVPNFKKVIPRLIPYYTKSCFMIGFTHYLMEFQPFKIGLAPSSLIMQTNSFNAGIANVF
jgi:hypothetical protein